MSERYDILLARTFEGARSQMPADELETILAERRAAARELTARPREMLALLEEKPELQAFLALDHKEATGKKSADPAADIYERTVDAVLKDPSGAPMRRDEDTPARRWIKLQEAWVGEYASATPDVERIAILRDKQREISGQIVGSVQDIAALANQAGVSSTRAAMGNPELRPEDVARYERAAGDYFMATAGAQAALAKRDFTSANEAEKKVEEAVIELRKGPLGYAFLGRGSKDERAARLSAEEVASTGKAKVDDYGTKIVQDLIDKRIKDAGVEPDTANRFIALTEVEEDLARRKDVGFRPYTKALGFAYAQEVASDPEAIARIRKVDPSIAQRAVLLSERADAFKTAFADKEAEALETRLSGEGEQKPAKGKDKSEKKVDKEAVRDEVKAQAREGMPGKTPELTIFAERVDQAVQLAYEDRLKEADKNNTEVVPKRRNKYLMRLADDYKIMNEADLVGRLETMKGSAFGIKLDGRFAAGGHVTQAVAEAAKTNPEAMMEMYNNTILLRNEIQKDVDFSASDEMKYRFDNLEFGRRVLAHGMIKAGVKTPADFNEDVRVFQSNMGKSIPRELRLDPEFMKPPEQAKQSGFEFDRFLSNTMNMAGRAVAQAKQDVKDFEIS